MCFTSVSMVSDLKSAQLASGAAPFRHDIAAPCIILPQSKRKSLFTRPIRRCWASVEKEKNSPVSRFQFPSCDERPEYDVVIVGAGIIGISVAHHILINTDLSVALIDANRPCAGATGAGQGYVWMSHRIPGTPGWFLAKRSKLLWERLAADVRASGMDPLKVFGWRNTGSLLVASTEKEASALQEWVQAFSGAGVPAQYLTAEEVAKAEPALALGNTISGGFFPEDSQMDANLSVRYLLEKIRVFSARGRYKELFQNPFKRFIGTPAKGFLQGVETQEGKVYCKKAVVLATGAWSSLVMSKATADWGLSVSPPIKPRKGHLLVLKDIENLHLKHGIMEFEYVFHSDNPELLALEELRTAKGIQSPVDLSMTATMDQDGNLLLGSSREFVGFDIHVQNEVVESIMKRAIKFLPSLSRASVQEALKEGKVRTGLRPFAVDGRPFIGTTQDVPGLIFATGHEGSGLCLSLATAEMVSNIVIGVKGEVDPELFSPVGRLEPSK